jgi:asparagine synthase (glutamine-hydrolysing)
MCGIAGAVGPIDLSVLQRMLETIVHRGPDDGNTYLEPGVGLGVRRLSVIDLAGGKQPMSNETGDVWTVFNGEIYNYRELREFLVKKGHQLKTHSDTEVIVHCYEEYGDACVHLLDGMFAFALWDAKRRRLLIARDRLGKKPLYYWHANGTLVFASEIKALLEHPEVSRAVDPEALSLYLALGYVPGPWTMFAGIKKLQPGHLLVSDDRGIKIEQYWDVTFLQPQRRVSADDAVDELRSRLSQAVRRRLIADVPLGALLSGGVDSSAIVALMAEASTKPVETFTVGFDIGDRFDEIAKARIVARTYATNHHEATLSALDVPKLLAKTMWHMDEPVADPAALPTHLICEFARRHVTVVLTGEGGDELFGGYPRYAWFGLAERLKRALPQSARGMLRRGADSMSTGEARSRLARVLMPFDTEAERHLEWVGAFSRRARATLGVRPSMNGAPDLPEQVVGEHLSAGPQDSLVHRLMYLDMKTWLADDILMKVDRMSMAVSLEARAPYLDHRLVEFIATLPQGLKVRGLQTKRLLRATAAELLPRSTARRPKHAFRVPVAHWLRGDLSEYMKTQLLAPDAAVLRYFDRAPIEALVKGHIAGTANHERRLWTLLCFESWHRTFIDRQPIS